MKTTYIKALAGLMLASSVSSCGDKFLDTTIFNGIDSEKDLTKVSMVDNLLNGAYDRFYNYRFTGNFSMSIADLASDIAYWNGSTSHQDGFYRLNYVDTDVTLKNIWDYGYKVIDTSSRVIQNAKKLQETVSDEEQAELSVYIAEAYALRAYSSFNLVNIFGHQIKCGGRDFSGNLGIVVVDTPIEAFAQVERSTVGETYTAILSDLNASIAAFEKAGYDRNDLFYFSEKAVYGLMARVKLYMEDFDGAKAAAKKALELAGDPALAYTASEYAKLFAGGASNTESLFALDINSTNNWSANSCGTQWTTYSYLPSPYLMSLYGGEDVRASIQEIVTNGNGLPESTGGKFVNSSGNTALGTNYLINAPEMHLIIAESNLRGTTVDTQAAAEALLVVAKRNPQITSTSDLPADKDGLMAFIRDESAREYFQEGHRLWDLRRWDATANFYAYDYPQIRYTFNDFNPADVIFPIPVDEINAGFGVVQTPDWFNGLPE